MRAPGFPGVPSSGWRAGMLLAPVAPRTTAEAHFKNDFGYWHDGQGGRSWAIPYVAGVLALGWQLQPEMTPKQMMSLLFETAYRREPNVLIIDPPAFIRALEQRP